MLYYNVNILQFFCEVIEMKEVKPARRRMVGLEYRDVVGRSVAVAGSFSDWSPRTMKDKDNSGVYRCRLLLEPGEYQYKFLVDGQWRTDSSNPDFVPNEYGSLNSVLVVVKR